MSQLIISASYKNTNRPDRAIVRMKWHAVWHLTCYWYYYVLSHFIPTTAL